MKRLLPICFLLAFLASAALAVPRLPSPPSTRGNASGISYDPTTSCGLSGITRDVQKGLDELSCGGGTPGGGIIGAPYITMSQDGQLTAERVFNPLDPLFKTDHGENNNVDLFLDFPTAGAVPDNADLILIEDALTGVLRSVSVADIQAAGSAHDLLSGTHSDTATATGVRGDLIVRDASEWNRLAIGALSGGKQPYLRSDGTDVLWGIIPVSDLPDTLALESEVPGLEQNDLDSNVSGRLPLNNLTDDDLNLDYCLVSGGPVGEPHYAECPGGGGGSAFLDAPGGANDDIRYDSPSGADEWWKDENGNGTYDAGEPLIGGFAIHVVDFNGINSIDGADIQAAIDSCGTGTTTGGGCRIVLPPQEILVDDEILIGDHTKDGTDDYQNGVWIIGTSMAPNSDNAGGDSPGTLLTWNGTGVGKAVISAIGSQFLTLQNFSVRMDPGAVGGTGAGDEPAQYGIKISADNSDPPLNRLTHMPRIQDVFIRGTWHGNQPQAGSVGIFVTGVNENDQVDQGIFQRVYIDWVDTGIWFNSQQSVHFLIHASEIQGYSTAIKVDATGSLAGGNFNFTDSLSACRSAGCTVFDLNKYSQISIVRNYTEMGFDSTFLRLASGYGNAQSGSLSPVTVTQSYIRHQCGSGCTINLIDGDIRSGLVFTDNRLLSDTIDGTADFAIRVGDDATTDNEQSYLVFENNHVDPRVGQVGNGPILCEIGTTCADGSTTAVVDAGLATSMIAVNSNEDTFHDLNQNKVFDHADKALGWCNGEIRTLYEGTVDIEAWAKACITSNSERLAGSFDSVSEIRIGAYRTWDSLPDIEPALKEAWDYLHYQNGWENGGGKDNRLSTNGYYAPEIVFDAGRYEIENPVRLNEVLGTTTNKAPVKIDFNGADILLRMDVDGSCTVAEFKAQSTNCLNPFPSGDSEFGKILYLTDACGYDDLVTEGCGPVAETYVAYDTSGVCDWSRGIAPIVASGGTHGFHSFIESNAGLLDPHKIGSTITMTGASAEYDTTNASVGRVVKTFNDATYCYVNPHVSLLHPDGVVTSDGTTTTLDCSTCGWTPGAFTDKMMVLRPFGETTGGFASRQLTGNTATQLQWTTPVSVGTEPNTDDIFLVVDLESIDILPETSGTAESRHATVMWDGSDWQVGAAGITVGGPGSILSDTVLERPQIRFPGWKNANPGNGEPKDWANRITGIRYSANAGGFQSAKLIMPKCLNTGPYGQVCIDVGGDIGSGYSTAKNFHLEGMDADNCGGPIDSPCIWVKWGNYHSISNFHNEHHGGVWIGKEGVNYQPSNVSIENSAIAGVGHGPALRYLSGDSLTLKSTSISGDKDGTLTTAEGSPSGQDLGLVAQLGGMTNTPVIVNVFGGEIDSNWSYLDPNGIKGVSVGRVSELNIWGADIVAFDELIHDADTSWNPDKIHIESVGTIIADHAVSIIEPHPSAWTDDYGALNEDPTRRSDSLLVVDFDQNGEIDGLDVKAAIDKSCVPKSNFRQCGTVIIPRGIIEVDQTIIIGQNGSATGMYSGLRLIGQGSGHTRTGTSELTGATTLAATNTLGNAPIIQIQGSWGHEIASIAFWGDREDDGTIPSANIADTAIHLAPDYTDGSGNKRVVNGVYRMLAFQDFDGAAIHHGCYVGTSYPEDYDCEQTLAQSEQHYWEQPIFVDVATAVKMDNVQTQNTKFDSLYLDGTRGAYPSPYSIAPLIEIEGGYFACENCGIVANTDQNMVQIESKSGGSEHACDVSILNSFFENFDDNANYIVGTGDEVHQCILSVQNTSFNNDSGGSGAKTITWLDWVNSGVLTFTGNRFKDQDPDASTVSFNVSDGSALSYPLVATITGNTIQSGGGGTLTVNWTIDPDANDGMLGNWQDELGHSVINPVSVADIRYVVDSDVDGDIDGADIQAAIDSCGHDDITGGGCEIKIGRGQFLIDDTLVIGDPDYDSEDEQQHGLRLVGASMADPSDSGGNTYQGTVLVWNGTGTKAVLEIIGSSFSEVSHLGIRMDPGAAGGSGPGDEPASYGIKISADKTAVTQKARQTLMPHIDNVFIRGTLHGATPGAGTVGVWLTAENNNDYMAQALIENSYIRSVDVAILSDNPQGAHHFVKNSEIRGHTAALQVDHTDPSNVTGGDVQVADSVIGCDAVGCAVFDLITYNKAILQRNYTEVSSDSIYLKLAGGYGDAQLSSLGPVTVDNSYVINQCGAGCTVNLVDGDIRNRLTMENMRIRADAIDGTQDFAIRLGDGSLAPGENPRFVFEGNTVDPRNERTGQSYVNYVNMICPVGDTCADGSTVSVIDAEVSIRAFSVNESGTPFNDSDLDLIPGPGTEWIGNSSVVQVVDSCNDAAPCDGRPDGDIDGYDVQHAIAGVHGCYDLYDDVGVPQTSGKPDGKCDTDGSTDVKKGIVQLPCQRIDLYDPLKIGKGIGMKGCGSGTFTNESTFFYTQYQHADVTQCTDVGVPYDCCTVGTGQGTCHDEALVVYGYTGDGPRTLEDFRIQLKNPQTGGHISGSVIYLDFAHNVRLVGLTVAGHSITTKGTVDGVVCDSALGVVIADSSISTWDSGIKLIQNETSGRCNALTSQNNYLTNSDINFHLSNENSTYDTSGIPCGQVHIVGGVMEGASHGIVHDADLNWPNVDDKMCQVSVQGTHFETGCIDDANIPAYTGSYNPQAGGVADGYCDINGLTDAPSLRSIIMEAGGLVSSGNLYQGYAPNKVEIGPQNVSNHSLIGDTFRKSSGPQSHVDHEGSGTVYVEAPNTDWAWTSTGSGFVMREGLGDAVHVSADLAEPLFTLDGDDVQAAIAEVMGCYDLYNTACQDKFDNGVGGDDDCPGTMSDDQTTGLPDGFCDLLSVGDCWAEDSLQTSDVAGWPDGYCDDTPGGDDTYTRTGTVQLPCDIINLNQELKVGKGITVRGCGWGAFDNYGSHFYTTWQHDQSQSAIGMYVGDNALEKFSIQLKNPPNTSLPLPQRGHGCQDNYNAPFTCPAGPMTGDQTSGEPDGYCDLYSAWGPCTYGGLSGGEVIRVASSHGARIHNVEVKGNPSGTRFVDGINCEGTLELTVTDSRVTSWDSGFKITQSMETGASTCNAGVIENTYFQGSTKNIHISNENHERWSSGLSCSNLLYSGSANEGTGIGVYVDPPLEASTSIGCQVTISGVHFENGGYDLNGACSSQQQPPSAWCYQDLVGGGPDGKADSDGFLLNDDSRHIKMEYGVLASHGVRYQGQANPRIEITSTNEGNHVSSGDMDRAGTADKTFVEHDGSGTFLVQSLSTDHIQDWSTSSGTILQPKDEILYVFQHTATPYDVLDEDDYIEAVSSAPAGSIVQLPKGQMFFTAPIVVSSPITVQGYGNGTEISCTGDCDAIVINSNDVVIRDLAISIDTDVAGDPDGIRCYDGDDTDQGGYDNLRVENVNILITGTEAPDGVGVRLVGCSDAEIIGSSISGAGHGIYVQPDGTDPSVKASDRLSVSNTEFVSNRYGITFVNSSYVAKQATVIASMFDNVDDGIRNTVADPFVLTLIGNVFKNHSTTDVTMTYGCVVSQGNRYESTSNRNIWIGGPGFADANCSVSHGDSFAAEVTNDDVATDFALVNPSGSPTTGGGGSVDIVDLGDIASGVGGTITKVGTTCISGECFEGGVSMGNENTLASLNDFVIRLDENADGVYAFKVLDDAGDTAFSVSELGRIDTAGSDVDMFFNETTYTDPAKTDIWFDVASASLTEVSFGIWVRNGAGLFDYMRMIQTDPVTNLTTIGDAQDDTPVNIAHQLLIENLVSVEYDEAGDETLDFSGAWNGYTFDGPIQWVSDGQGARLELDKNFGSFPVLNTGVIAFFAKEDSENKPLYYVEEEGENREVILTSRTHMFSANMDSELGAGSAGGNKALLWWKYAADVAADPAHPHVWETFYMTREDMVTETGGLSNLCTDVGGDDTCDAASARSGEEQGEKTTYGWKKEAIKQTPGQMYGMETAIYGASDGDNMAQFNLIYGMGGAKSAGDEGDIGVRIQIRDHWRTPFGTVTSDSGADRVLSPAVSTNLWKAIGVGQHIVYTDETCVDGGACTAADTILNATIDEYDSLNDMWTGDGGEDYTADCDGGSCVGWCFGLKSNNYEDETQGTQVTTMPVIRVNGVNGENCSTCLDTDQFRTEWIAQDTNYGAPPNDFVPTTLYSTYAPSPVPVTDGFMFRCEEIVNVNQNMQTVTTDEPSLCNLGPTPNISCSVDADCTPGTCEPQGPGNDFMVVPYGQHHQAGLRVITQNKLGYNWGAVGISVERDEDGNDDESNMGLHGISVGGNASVMDEIYAWDNGITVAQTNRAFRFQTTPGWMQHQNTISIDTDNTDFFTDEDGLSLIHIFDAAPGHEFIFDPRSHTYMVGESEGSANSTGKYIDREQVTVAISTPGINTTAKCVSPLMTGMNGWNTLNWCNYAFAASPVPLYHELRIEEISLTVTAAVLGAEADCTVFLSHSDIRDGDLNCNHPDTACADQTIVPLANIGPTDPVNGPWISNWGDTVSICDFDADGDCADADANPTAYWRLVIDKRHICVGGTAPGTPCVDDGPCGGGTCTEQSDACTEIEGVTANVIYSIYRAAGAP